MSSRRVVIASGLVGAASMLAACNGILGNEERGLAKTPDGGGGALADRLEEAELTIHDGGTVPGDRADAMTEGDGGSDAAPVFVGCFGDAGCPRVVFTTALTFTGGEIGGVAGGDAKCQAAADASPLARIRNHRFRVWLSDTTTQPLNRLTQGTAVYVTMRGPANPTEVLVSSSFSSLVNGLPQNPIANESGVVTEEGAWTGTANSGNRAADRCSDWTTTSGNGLTGDPDQPGTWSQDDVQACNKTFKLLCFEE